MSEIKQPKKYYTASYCSDSTEYKLADLLIHLVNDRRNDYKRFFDLPGAMETIIQNSAHEFHLLMTKNNRDANEILDVLEYSQEDDFWKNNIRSGYKFRTQYEKLLVQMSEQELDLNIDDPNEDVTNKIIGIYRALISNPDYKSPIKNYYKFVDASERLITFTTERDISIKDMIEYLLACLEKHYVDKGEVVHPGNLCSDYTWDVLMPAYLSEIGL